MPCHSLAIRAGMNFPGKKKLRHWWWIVAFKYPWVRVALTRALVRSRNMDVSMFGAPLHINSREEIGLLRAARMADENVIFRDEVATLLNLAMLLQPRDTFVDVGANVGIYSSVLSRFGHVFPETRWYAIEPNPATVQRLRKSLAKTPVTIWNLGASDQAGERGFEPGVTSGVFRVVADSAGAASVRCERLDSLPLAGDQIVIKIDVEGHEGPVLRGADRLFENERVKVVYIDGFNDAQIPAFLEARGFKLFDGRTLLPCAAPDYSLMAIHHTRLARS